jgi:hypothetical protein
MHLITTGLCCALLTASAGFSQQSGWTPKHEIGLTLGGFLTTDRKASSGQLTLGTGTDFQANYGYKLAEGAKAALYGEVHFLANPQRLVTSTDQSLTRDVATIYVTPGVRVKFLPRAAISPYLAAGGGYAVYEQSLNRLDGMANMAPRTIHRGAFDFGGGVDVRFWRFIGLRVEIRDFYTGSPAYNTASLSGGQHNVVAGGGFILRFR